MKVKSIPSRWIYEEGLRLDCNPYMSGSIESRSILERLSVNKQKLSELTKDNSNGIFNGPQFRRNYVLHPDHGVPFLTSGNFHWIDLTSLPLLRKEDALSNKLLHLKVSQGTTLISCSGTIGRMVYARPDMDGLWSSQDVLKVVPDSDKILPGYLFCFLSSKFGLPLILSGTYGAVIQHIEPHHITELPVPIAPKRIQMYLHNLIEKSAYLRSESVQRYKAATSKIFEAIGVKDPARHEWLSNTSARSFQTRKISSSTLRAINYDPRYLSLCEEIKQGEFDFLGDICDPKHFKSGIIFKRIDADREFSARLIGQREAFQIRPEGRWISKRSIEGLGLIVPKGTTIIAAHGTLGETELYCRSAFVTSRTSSYAFSGDFVRCIPLKDKILPGYLFAFLRSEAAFRILRAISIGGKQQAHHPDLLWHMPIPRLNPESELEIHKLVEQGSSNLDKALDLEDQAWSKLETWIMEEAA